jgi:HK97 family phage major capsid protein
MALTKAQAAPLSNDLLLAGVIETIVNESQLLHFLPFMEVTGTAVRYARETTTGTTTWYDVGDTWTESTATFSEQTATLKILGGDADVDNFIAATYADTNDIEAEIIREKAKSVAYSFSTAFFTGNAVTNPKQFDGVNRLVTGARAMSMGTNGAALTLDKLDEMIDMVKPGKPELLLMSKRTRRQLKALRRGSGNILEVNVRDFGLQVETYDGIPIIVDDFLPENETLGTGTNLSSIYAFKFGQGAGLMGLEHGGIQAERVGELETKDATRTRLKWYCGLALFNDLGAARLQGITA